MPDQRPPTQRDIARSAGVCAMTVSRARRNDSHISRSEVLRIRKLAARMGYALNPYLSSWMRNVRRRQPIHERETIACIRPSSRENVTSRMIMEGAARFAGGTGYRVESFALDNYPDPRVLFRILRHRGIRGIIIAALNTPLPDELWQHSVVWVHAPRDYPQADFVDHDYYEGMMIALEKLTAYGYRRIAYWSIMLIEPHQRWDAAYLQYQSRIPRERRLPIFRNFREFSFGEMDHWLKTYRPDAVVCAEHHFFQSDFPRRIKEVAWANLGVDSDPIFAGIDQHLELVGENAARMVTRKMELNEIGPSAQPRTITVHPTWRDGPSAPPLKTSRCSR